MNTLRHLTALLLLAPASAFATFKFCDIYQGQIMECRAEVAIASYIPVYRDNAWHDCYIQAGQAIYCDAPTNARGLPVAGREGYRDCDIQSGVITSCGAYSSVTHFPLAVTDEEPRVWKRWLKTAVCFAPALLRPESCEISALPEEITFFPDRGFPY